MKLTKIKLIELLTNGSIIFSYESFIALNQVIFFEKDHKNLFFNKYQDNKVKEISSKLNSHKKRYKF